MRNTFRLAVTSFLTVAGLFGSGVSGQSAAKADPQPVVIELFTSQGCSSCPPADELLAELGNRDDVIPLALHVDYWDYIGWKDRFAAPEFSKRQRGYARAGGWKMIYTPQMVVMGVEDVVGSKPERVGELISKYAGQDGPLDLTLVRRGDRVEIRIVADGAVRPCDIHVVRYEPSERVTIKRGENAGRSITYTHIVRDWNIAARWDGVGVFEGEVPVPDGEPVVVLVQAPKNGPILAAARLR
jgi:hypothetical protein